MQARWWILHYFCWCSGLGSSAVSLLAADWQDSIRFSCRRASGVNYYPYRRSCVGVMVFVVLQRSASVLVAHTLASPRTTGSWSQVAVVAGRALKMSSFAIGVGAAGPSGHRSPLPSPLACRSAPKNGAIKPRGSAPSWWKPISRAPCGPVAQTAWIATTKLRSLLGNKAETLRSRRDCATTAPGAR